MLSGEGTEVAVKTNKQTPQVPDKLITVEEAEVGKVRLILPPHSRNAVISCLQTKQLLPLHGSAIKYADNNIIRRISTLMDLYFFS